MKTRALILIMATPIFPCADAADNDPLQGLDFLLGEWRADPPAKGGDVFRRDLDGKIMVRSAHAEDSNRTNVGTMKMTMTLYAEPGRGVLAIYFDNAGHVIHYNVGELVPGRSLRLDSDASIPGPRFRLTYLARGNDELAVKFEMAPPGGQVDYKIVAEGSEKRVTR